MKIEKVKIYPSLIEQAKKQLRIEESFIEDDNIINSKILASILNTENYIESDIVDTENTLIEEYFKGYEYKIYTSTFQELISIQYLNAEGNYIDLNPKVKHFKEYILFEFDKYFETDELEIVFKTGFKNNIIPDNIKEAILIKTTELYDVDRSNYTSSNVTKSNLYELLLKNYKRVII